MLDEVKKRLNITEADFDSQLLSIIDEGKAFLKKINPLIDDFSCGTQKKLLIAYCRYAFNESENEFEENYRSDLMELRREYEVSCED